MEAHLELWIGGDARLLGMDSAAITVGRGADNDIALPFDPTVSRLHAVISRYRAGWCLRDVGSSNGTFLNGERLLREQLLHSGDEIRVGATRIVFRAGASPDVDLGSTIQSTDRPPELTRRERDVLVALCRPLLGSETFAQPASNHDIAEELVVGAAAVKFHLANLYDKFAIHGGQGSKRTRLASEAVRRGLVSRSDLYRGLSLS